MSLLIWKLSGALTQGSGRILTLSALPFQYLESFFDFNSPFIPIVDLMTSSFIVKGRLFEILWLIIGFIPQALILLGMLWDKKMIKRRIIIIASLSSAICLIAIISNVLLYTHGIYNDNVIGNTSGNLNSDGKMSIQGNWIYSARTERVFVLPFKGLYKTKINGRSDTLLYNGDAMYINVVGKWVYFVDGLGGNKCYKISTDGGEKNLVSSDEVSYMLVYDRYIYYKNDSDGGKLYRMDCSGNQKTKLTDDEANSISIDSGFILYGNSNGIFRMRMDCSDKQLIYKDDIKSFVVKNDSIYFLNNKEMNTLVGIDFEGNKTIDLDIYNVSNYNFTGNLIFYEHYFGNEGNIYYVDYNGKGQGYKKINGVDYFYVIKDFVFLLQD